MSEYTLTVHGREEGSCRSLDLTGSEAQLRASATDNNDELIKTEDTIHEIRACGILWNGNT